MLELKKGTVGTSWNNGTTEVTVLRQSVTNVIRLSVAHREKTVTKWHKTVAKYDTCECNVGSVTAKTVAKRAPNYDKSVTVCVNREQLFAL